MLVHVLKQFLSLLYGLIKVSHRDSTTSTFM